MNEWIKKHWHDPVWSKVIATVLLTLFAGVGTYLFDWWPTIVKVSKGIIDFVFSNTAIPNWLLAILLFPLLMGLLLIGVLIRNRVFPKKQMPTWINYTKDTIFGIQWTWHYGEANKIVDLYSFCPTCGFQIYPQPQSNWMQGFTHTAFHCENCGQNFEPHPEQVPQLENKVVRHIQLKIRNNTWSTPQ